MPKRAADNPDTMMIHLCRSSKWDEVLRNLQHNPSLATTRMIMDNHIATTIVHQAINSKSDTKVREHVILTILRVAPQAASIRNGYNSLPIHVITQRNTKMDSQTKERLILALIQAYPESLVEAGGVGQRTPLHIIFTDYISPRIVKRMVELAPRACSMRDKNGWLPIHVACSRHCSPEKLRMLLHAHPSSLYQETPNGETLLYLAKTYATKSHPNHALINELTHCIEENSNHTSGAGHTMNHPLSTPEDRRDEYVQDTRKVLYAGEEIETAEIEPITPISYPVTRNHRNKRVKREMPPPGESNSLANLLLHFHRNANEDTREHYDGDEDVAATFEGQIEAV